LLDCADCEVQTERSLSDPEDEPTTETATSLANPNKDKLPNQKQCRESEREHACLQSEPKDVQEEFFERPAPCQLATQLASNGNADIARSVFDIDAITESNEVDGVECSKAYQMLARFATTEDKLNIVCPCSRRWLFFR
jgi:hypothetical protein